MKESNKFFIYQVLFIVIVCFLGIIIFEYDFNLSLIEPILYTLFMPFLISLIFYGWRQLFLSDINNARVSCELMITMFKFIKVACSIFIIVTLLMAIIALNQLLNNTIEFGSFLTFILTPWVFIRIFGYSISNIRQYREDVAIQNQIVNKSNQN